MKWLMENPKGVRQEWRAVVQKDAVKAQIVHRLFIKMLLFILRESGRILGSLREIDESIGEKK